MVIISEHRTKKSLWQKISIFAVVVAVAAFAVQTIRQKTNNTSIPVLPSGSEGLLSLPFAKGTNVRIAEGWLYSAQEQQIHGRKVHYSIDFAAERGTPVYAAADGLAVASFDTEEDGKYQDKTIGFGYGRFVQVWNAETGLFAIYAHLETIAPTISYEEPTHTELGWKPLLPKSAEEIKEHQSTPIKKGDLIGYVGDSGLTWGYTETPQNRPDPAKFPSWDETHLHFEVFRYNAAGEKEAFDPYGLYAAADKYTINAVGTNSLWEIGENGLPRYAGRAGQ